MRAPIVNPRLTILDVNVVGIGSVYVYSAERDFKPIFRGLCGVKLAGEDTVRGISPGYLCIGEQVDILAPVNVVIDENANGFLAALTLTGIASAATVPTLGAHLTNKAYVDAQVAAVEAGDVDSFNGRIGIVVPVAGDYAANLVTFTPVGFIADFATNVQSAIEEVVTYAAATLLGSVQLQAATPGAAQTGHANLSGTVIAGAFSGVGTAVTNVNAALLLGASWASPASIGTVLPPNEINSFAYKIRSDSDLFGGIILAADSGIEIRDLEAPALKGALVCRSVLTVPNIDAFIPSSVYAYRSKYFGINATVDHAEGIVGRVNLDLATANLSAAIITIPVGLRLAVTKIRFTMLTGDFAFNASTIIAAGSNVPAHNNILRRNSYPELTSSLKHTTEFAVDGAPFLVAGETLKARTVISAQIEGVVVMEFWGYYLLA